MKGSPENKAAIAQKRRADRVREIRAQGRPELTFELASPVLSAFPIDGILRHKVTRGGQKAGSVAGTPSQGYNLVFIGYHQFKAARVMWVLMTGKPIPAGMVVDHINGDRHDDRWSNLRLATPAENARNRGFCRRNTSGKVGVHLIKQQGKWGASIGIDGREINLGRYDSLDEAIAARRAAEIVYYGEFARVMPEAYANG